MNRRAALRGAALLEFALALPFAVTLFAGIGDIAAFFWRQAEMEEVARRTAARVAPQRDAYAGAGHLPDLSRTLQETLRAESRSPGLSLTLARRYACPRPDGSEGDSAAVAQHCEGERIYLQIEAKERFNPLFRPLRALGFPEKTLSRHAIRLR